MTPDLSPTAVLGAMTATSWKRNGGTNTGGNSVAWIDHTTASGGASAVLGYQTRLARSVAFPMGLALLLLPWLARAQSYSIDWSTMDGGGGTSTGGVYSVSGTIGQPDAGAMSGGTFTLVGGFWAMPGLVQTPGAPTLYITNAGPGWATIWWHPPTPGFVLQETLSLATTNWLYSLSGATNPVVVPATLPARFYRLRKP